MKGKLVTSLMEGWIWLGVITKNTNKCLLRSKISLYWVKILCLIIIKDHFSLNLSDFSLIFLQQLGVIQVHLHLILDVLLFLLLALILHDVLHEIILLRVLLHSMIKNGFKQNLFFQIRILQFCFHMDKKVGQKQYHRYLDLFLIICKSKYILNLPNQFPKNFSQSSNFYHFGFHNLQLILHGLN